MVVLRGCGAVGVKRHVRMGHIGDLDFRSAGQPRLGGGDRYFEELGLPGRNETEGFIGSIPTPDDGDISGPLFVDAVKKPVDGWLDERLWAGLSPCIHVRFEQQRRLAARSRRAVREVAQSRWPDVNPGRGIGGSSQRPASLECLESLPGQPGRIAVDRIWLLGRDDRFGTDDPRSCRIAGLMVVRPPPVQPTKSLPQTIHRRTLRNHGVEAEVGSHFNGLRGDHDV